MKFNVKLYGTAFVYAYAEVEADSAEEATRKGLEEDTLMEVEWIYGGIDEVNICETIGQQENQP